ncbi:helix-turn-helix transcriptional regulator [Kurthia gibsonii]|uniref:helix-turn-helix transcriptional regulator n=1 Tax=Kurthia gibsonii TaxID=33946 RepID=UPI0031B6E0AF
MKNHVRDLRMQYGLSQDALAEKVGVSRQTIISLEKGKYNPSIMLAFKLARVFRCQIEDLFIYEEENT